MFCYRWSVEEDWTWETNVLLYLLTEHKCVEASPRRMEEGCNFWTKYQIWILKFGVTNIPDILSPSVIVWTGSPSSNARHWLRLKLTCHAAQTNRAMFWKRDTATVFTLLLWMYDLFLNVKLAKNKLKVESTVFSWRRSHHKTSQNLPFQYLWQTTEQSVISDGEQSGSRAEFQSYVCGIFRSDSSFWNVWTFAGSNQNYYQDIFSLKHYF